MMEANSLAGRVSLVTGAGTRLGAAIAKRLATEGSDVIIHYYQSMEGAQDTLRAVQDAGRHGVLIQADLGSQDDVLKLAAATQAVFGKLDALINNASIYPESSKPNAGHGFLQESIEEWDRALAINARAPFFLMQQLAPLLSASPSGSVVNILDTSASVPFASRSSHSVSKAALRSVNDIAARALKGKVRVNGLELGAILPPTGSPEEFVQSRTWGGADVVCDAVVFLLTNHFMTGEVLRCAGAELL